MANRDLIEKLREQISSIDSSIELSAPEASDRANEAFQRDLKTDHSRADDALKKIIALVNASDKSERSIRERLAKAEFEPDAIDEAVDRAKSYGFINDMRFAEVLIRSRISQGKGSAGIERELKSHNIDPYEVPGWPYEYEIDDSTELDRALAYLERKPPRSKNLREEAYRKLVQKGYSSAVASSAARKWSERSE